MESRVNKSTLYVFQLEINLKAAVNCKKSNKNITFLMVSKYLYIRQQPKSLQNWLTDEEITICIYSCLTAADKCSLNKLNLGEDLPHRRTLGSSSRCVWAPSTRGSSSSKLRRSGSLRGAHSRAFRRSPIQRSVLIFNTMSITIMFCHSFIQHLSVALGSRVE